MSLLIYGEWLMQFTLMEILKDRPSEETVQVDILLLRWINSYIKKF